MSTTRDYQLDYSLLHPEVTDRASRQRKAVTAARVLESRLGCPPTALRILDVGGSSGVMAEFMAAQGNTVTVIDVDEHAIGLALAGGGVPGVDFRLGDAMAIPFADAEFDVVLCCHVYEHVPDPHRMMDEILRVLRPGGLCYFTAGNRLAWREPHYGLPLLSVLPRRLADLYLRISGMGQHYHEKHLTLWGLRELIHDFRLIDMTPIILDDPARFGVDYMVRPGSILQYIARFIARRMPAICPGFIWVLAKRGTSYAGHRPSA